MNKARIHNAATSTQSEAEGKGRDWLIEFAPDQANRIDPLTGWYGSDDTQRQVVLRFGSRDDAVAYARAQGWDYDVEERRQVSSIKPKSYADNFRYDRKINWTH